MSDNIKRMVNVSKWEKNEEKGHYETVPDGKAMFHGFGVDCQETYDAIGTYSTAIIERIDGSIENLPLILIQFIDPHPDLKSEAGL